jgi:hypothetical protein
MVSEQSTGPVGIEVATHYRVLLWCDYLEGLERVRQQDF